MTSMVTRLAMLAGIAAIGLTGPLMTTPAASAQNFVKCMTDDGYGRKSPCSGLYKSQNPAWRAGDSCFTDDGYGRFRPCSAGYKAKHKK